jgi:ABC-type Fe3+/spermidine/putrescine transport system ATPase subunit
MKEVLRVTGLGQAFNGTKVLHGTDFSLEAGERLAVLGPSGSGKTTLLRLIAGLEAPKEGEIAIEGKAASRAGEVLIAPEHREVALVFQGLALFPHLRALEQIAFAARGRGGIERARSLLERIGLGHRANAPLDQLSGGERQRIALARALAQEPKLLLMDEPFASLDDEKRGEMRDLLRSLLERTETTLILVTHSREDALDLARRVIVLERGGQVACGPLETVLVRPQHAAAVRALGLGQIIEGEMNAAGEVETAFGKVRATAGAKPGKLRLLVRPGQPRIVTDGEGVEAEVVALELRPSETREVRRVAVVRVAGKQLRLFVRERVLAIGGRVQVKIEGECELVEG